MTEHGPGAGAEAVAIRLARQTDVPGLLELESRYYVGNLDESQRAEGFISILFSRDWFEDTIAGGGLHVAVIGDTTVGFIAVTDPPPRTTPGLPPLTTAMLDLAETIEFNGAPIAEQRYALRGPVLIGEQARGRGIYGPSTASLPGRIETATTSRFCLCPPTIRDRCTPRPPNWGPHRWRCSRRAGRPTTSWRSPSVRGPTSTPARTAGTDRFLMRVPRRSSGTTG